MKALFKKQKTAFTYHRYYVIAQDKWAQKMHAWTNGLSKQKLICLLVLFILCGGLFFIHTMYAAFSGNDAKSVQNTAVGSKIKTIHLKK